MSTVLHGIDRVRLAAVLATGVSFTVRRVD